MPRPLTGPPKKPRASSKPSSRRTTTTSSSSLHRTMKWALVRHRQLKKPASYQVKTSRSPRLTERRTLSKHLPQRSEEHTSELQSRGHLVCRLLLEKKKHSNTKHPQ